MNTARARSAVRARCVIFLCALFEAGCASTEATSSLQSQGEVTAEAQPVRRRRRRARPVAEPAADPSVVAEAPTPVSNRVDGATQSDAPAPVMAGAIAAPPLSPFAPRRGIRLGASGGAPALPPATFGTPAATVARGPEVSVRLGRDDAGQIVARCVRPQGPAVYCPQCAAQPNTAATVRAFYPAERSVLACRPPANRRGRFGVRARFDSSGVATEVSAPGFALSPDALECLGEALCSARVPTFREPTATLAYEYVVLVPSETDD